MKVLEGAVRKDEKVTKFEIFPTKKYIEEKEETAIRKQGVLEVDASPKLRRTGRKSGGREKVG